MGKPRAEVVRFAVGAPDEPRSLVWRVWMTKGKSDLYISGRLQGGDWKFSLHESGDWRFGLTREFAKARGMAERLIFEQWERPQPLRDGVTSAFEIMVPSAELALPRQPLPEDRRKHTEKVTWFPPAPEGCATHFIVMYTEPGWPTPEAAPDFLSIFTLPDGRTVSIMVLEQAIPVDQQRQIDACRQALVEGMSRSSAESRAAFEAALEPRGYLYGHNEFGTRFFIDISGSPLLEE
jgi:hypothetical protein